MGLASRPTSLTGMTAAETQIDVSGNNLANSQTVGFKSSSVVFSTQFLQTLSVVLCADTGGTDRRSAGTQVSASRPTSPRARFRSAPAHRTWPSRERGCSSFRVPIRSDCTRTGIFSLNSANQLVTPTGQLLLGYGVDEEYRIQTTA